MPAAGWYIDPRDDNQARWWDGSRWTGECNPIHTEFHRRQLPKFTFPPTVQPKPPLPASPVAQLICPHCGVRGRVRSRSVKVKRGISGGKATAALATAGFSVLATGLSRKATHVERTCGNCETTWLI